MNETVTQAVLALAEAVLASEEHQALMKARADVLADPEMARLWRAVGNACPRRAVDPELAKRAGGEIELGRLERAELEFGNLLAEVNEAFRVALGGRRKGDCGGDERTRT